MPSATDGFLPAWRCGETACSMHVWTRRWVLNLERPMPKPYAIIRVMPIKKRADLRNATLHGMRQDGGTHYDPERTLFNRHWMAGRVERPIDWEDALASVLERRNVTVRKNGALAAELFLGASPEYFEADDGSADLDPEKLDRWVDANQVAIYGRWGDAVAGMRLDLDESSPHLSVLLVPIYQKATRDGPVPTVSYRREFGGETKVELKQKLSALQDWYAEQMRPLGLSRGISKAVTGAVGKTHQEYRRIRQREDAARRDALRAAQGVEAAAREHERAAVAAYDAARADFVAIQEERDRLAAISAVLERKLDWMNRAQTRIREYAADKQTAADMARVTGLLLTQSREVEDLKRQIGERPDVGSTVDAADDASPTPRV